VAQLTEECVVFNPWTICICWNARQKILEKSWKSNIIDKLHVSGSLKLGFLHGFHGQPLLFAISIVLLLNQLPYDWYTQVPIAEFLCHMAKMYKVCGSAHNNWPNVNFHEKFVFMVVLKGFQGNFDTWHTSLDCSCLILWFTWNIHAVASNTILAYLGISILCSLILHMVV
jgi:hypothetical protein